MGAVPPQCEHVRSEEEPGTMAPVTYLLTRLVDVGSPSLLTISQTQDKKGKFKMAIQRSQQKVPTLIFFVNDESSRSLASLDSSSPSQIDVAPTMPKRKSGRSSFSSTSSHSKCDAPPTMPQRRYD
ncbi:unnamed protein product [Cylindrotheca closterium]|uniref:Uncharacterized protein n=1 Tax=Cylindrotheca closterium TaxID=2856 RepID=A0AAD2JK68_9STRA|nr:unnamed protein product [Cylindrotheca closterium]